MSLKNGFLIRTAKMKTSSVLMYGHSVEIERGPSLLTEIEIRELLQKSRARVPTVDQLPMPSPITRTGQLSESPVARIHTCGMRLATINSLSNYEVPFDW